MNSMDVRTILIAGGGTGGHVYPALAIADAIKSINKNCIVEFVGSISGIESKAVPAKGYTLYVIPIGRFHSSVGWKERLVTLVTLPLALLRAGLLLLRARPSVVLGVGGYASFPVVFMASIMGFTTYIWEPNAHPGLANQILSWFADKSLVVFESAAAHLRSKKIQKVGLPVRTQIEKVISQPAHADFRIFVFGGSLGARAINDCLMEIAASNVWKKGFAIVQQTGAKDYERVSQFMGPRKNWQVMEYVYDIENYYSWADVVICRAGASTLAELAACGKPSILIPFPHASDNHQYQNAKEFESKGAAIVIDQKILTPLFLAEVVADLMQNRTRLEDMAQAARMIHQPQAATEIAKTVLGS